MFVNKEERPSGEVKSFSEVMNKAADLIQDRGRSVGMFYHRSGALCMFAAVQEAATGKALELDSQGEKLHEVQTNYHKELNEFLIENYCYGICGYNNTHTQEEVIAILRKAAVEA